MKTKILILSFLLLFSCDIQKKAIKNKEDRILKEQTEIITKRVGDTVSYFVPKIIYKDTTIVKTNYVTGTTQRLRYNSQGQIDLAECISGAIEEITRSNKELIETIKQKDQEKEENFDSSFMLYIVMGVVIVILISGFFAYKTINKNASTIANILNKV